MNTILPLPAVASVPRVAGQALPRLLCFLALFVLAHTAQAVPSFARQTGLACASCHSPFPQLTPLGRRFKLGGYTMANTDPLANPGADLMPLAVMLEGTPGFTHTRKAQAEGDLPARFDGNDNVAVNQASLFYAGRLLGPYAEALTNKAVGDVLDKIGVFVQATWDGIEDSWSWDNVEARAATPLTLAGHDLVVGTYVNNNPSMGDLWNTTPAWSFPFAASGLAPAPTAAPLLAGGLSQQVLGFGTYAMVDDLLYVDAGAYSTLAAGTQRAFGVDPTGEARIDGLAPYWRLALERTRGAHSVELGTYGLYASTYPQRDARRGTDHFTDIGLDAQYQFFSALHDLTLRANWLHEKQTLGASQRLGLASNRGNTLWNASFSGAYLYDKTYAANVQYFVTAGSRDPLLYATNSGAPDANGWVFELDWLPFNKAGGPSFWPMSNLKLSLQYTLYGRFDGSAHNYDGSGRNASDNDTLYLSAWLSF
ncbi:MAG: cytochrome C [Gammaproteobacteria bacterium]|nr:cytochrome C [Gammaproteobacteria bacterium]